MRAKEVRDSLKESRTEHEINCAITDAEYPATNSDIDTDSALRENENTSIELENLNIDKFRANSRPRLYRIFYKKNHQETEL